MSGRRGDAIELILEFLLQAVVEIFGDLIVHSVAGSRRVRNVVLAFLGYSIAGVAVGYLTVFVFPSHFIERPDLRRLNLLVTPLVIGIVMASYGRLRRSREKDVVGFEKFVYAYVFALAVAVVRYFTAS